MRFPPNPSDGTVFEPASGLYYIYSSRTNEWVQCVGFDQMPLADQSKDGLMSKEDYQKLDNLIIPPPQTVLSSEDCDYVFADGPFCFRSINDNLIIDHELDMVNGGIISKEVFKIHDDTYGYNFKVNIDKLIEELEDRGNIKYCRSIGLQGDQGDPGDPGADELDTGPQGDDGDSGADIAFPGSILQDAGALSDNTRGLVDVRVEKSTAGNYLIFTRANIGNPDACPKEVRPKNFRSPWVLAIENDPAKAKWNKNIIENDCRYSCAPCINLRYLDIETIIQPIVSRYLQLAEQLRTQKEELVNKWLQTMISTFITQRSAICCALENCESNKRNQDERRYIEQSRIQAAQANFQLLVDGIEKRNVFDLNDPENCIVPGGSATYNSDVCNTCTLTLIIDPKLNTNNSNPIIGELEPGNYVAEITDCCASYFPGSGYSGNIVMEYETPDGTSKINLKTLGTYASNKEARNKWLGYQWSFNHNGGLIKAWFPDSSPADNDGVITVCIKPAGCFDGSLIGPGPWPKAPGVSVSVSQIRWYERGWRTGTCCGAYVVYGGQKWIIVYRNIGADLTCGGGESINTTFIKAYLDRGFPQPALAYPTSDGDVFLGVPISGAQAFTYDSTLSNALIDKIRKNQAQVKKGDPDGNINIILFPVMM